MQHLRYCRSFLSTIALSIYVAGGLPAHAARTVGFEFHPPEIKPQAVCNTRPPDEVTTELWAAWDGKALPNMDSALIKRDLNRLLHLDAVKWFDTVDLMISRLAERDPSFDGQNAVLTRILAMEAAEEFDELRRLNLVEQLLADEPVLSPRVLGALSRFYSDGIGVKRDLETSNRLLVSAGYSGNADALLMLSRMTLEGTAPADWNVPLELAISMAFGSLVGELNETICDRTARIAREYLSGHIVTENRQLAHDWFRFTADMGDPYAAWKVVEFHMQAEKFQKSNEILLKYLTQASDAGLPYAQIELGRMYETGALVPQDLDRALSLYLKASQNGERPGLTRVALFLEQQPDLIPESETLRSEMLEKLVQLEDPPAWAFTRLAEVAVSQKGIWRAAEEAKTLLARAAELEDLDGTVRYAKLLLAEGQDPQNFEHAVDLLSRTVSIYGGVNPSKDLYSAFMCQAADAPRQEEAAYWLSTEVATASANLDLTTQQILTLNQADNPLEIATLQSHALYGRPTALAAWLKLIETADFATPEMHSFWESYSDRYSQVLQALAKLELELAQNRSQKLAAFAMLREEYLRSGTDAALSLAQALLDSRNSESPEEVEKSRTEAKALLSAAAIAGKGQAIELIASLDGTEDSRRATFEAYRETIETSGDFHAFIFAIPFVDAKTRKDFVARATGVMHCDYKNAMSMAQMSFSIGDRLEARRWMEIAELLTGGNAWALTDLARLRLREGLVEDGEHIATLLGQAAQKGDQSAARELFQLYIATDFPMYDTATAAEMVDEAVDAGDFDLLSGYLGRLRKIEPNVRDAVWAHLNRPKILLAAASAGDIYSMRSYGQYLRDVAQDAETLRESTDWLRKAAYAGDATAMAGYGQALAFGIGVEPDSLAAQEFLRRAAEEGSKSAAQITELITLSKGN